MNNIYYLDNRWNFLENLTDYVISHYKRDFDKLTIILPTGTLCAYLHQALAKKLGNSILPRIVPINSTEGDGIEMYFLDKNEINVISLFEERAILSEIIFSLNLMQYDITQSIKLSFELASIFYEFEINGIDLNNIKNNKILSKTENPAILDFLTSAYKLLQKRLKKINKISRGQYRKILFKSQIEKLIKNPDQSILVAAVAPSNSIEQDFIEEINKLENGKVILPPCYDSNTMQFHDVVYRLKKFVQKNNYQLINLTNIEYSKSFDLLLKTNLTNIKAKSVLENKVKYILFNDVFQEAEYIANYITDIISRNINSKICIIVNDNILKTYYNDFLNKYLLRAHDLVGTNVLAYNITSFLLGISDLVCSGFSVKRFCSLITNPLINNLRTQILEQYILDHHPFSDNIKEIEESLKLYDEVGIYSFFENFYHIFSVKINKSDYNFHSILMKIIEIMESLLPDVWQNITHNKIGDVISEIIDIKWQLKIEKLDNFTILLRELLSKAKISDDNAFDNNIIFARAEEISFIDFDVVFISNFNEDAHSANSQGNPWISEKGKESLSLCTKIESLGMELYNFYLNLHNAEVIITRAESVDNGKRTTESTFISKLIYLFKDNLESIKANKIEVDNKILEEPLSVTAPYFANTISATGVETLIRAPYNFYASKILNLIPNNSLREEPNVADFGTFFHRIVDEYNKQYVYLKNSANINDKIDYFMHITDKITNTTTFTKEVKKKWKIKMSSLAKEFVIFDEKPRMLGSLIYTEVSGNMHINIEGKSVNVTAIADRIEIDNDNVTIIDYKTGTIPSKADLESGLSPQLLVETLILLSGGFNLCDKDQLPQKICKIMYVKINSNKPYIQSDELILDDSVINKHRTGFNSFLEYYVKEKSFLIKPNLSRYDDYIHLARRF